MNTKANMEQAHQDIEYIFSELLPKHGFLEREAQKTLSHNMLDAMICRRIALCDAGTGIGKTYAYLVAGIVYIRFRKAENRELKPIVVSTSSIALQNAVINEYLPFLSSVLLEAGMLDHPVRAALRKGKQHYVCDSRREQRLKQFVSAKGAHRRKRALLYLEREVDMDNVKGLPAYEKSNICVPTVCQCRLNTCQYKQYIAQRNSLLYLFQVCNHNLLIADAIHKADGKASILPESCAVIVDEAHKLPEVARQMFGTSLSGEDFRQVFAMMRKTSNINYMEFAAKATGRLLDLLDEAPKEMDFADYTEAMVLPYQILSTFYYSHKDQIEKTLRQKLGRLLRSLQIFLEYENREELVCYAEESDGGTVLWATLYHIDNELRRILWRQFKGMVLTSGTIAVGNDFHSFREAVGLPPGGRVVESVSESPFDYMRNTLLYMPELPPAYHEWAPEQYEKELVSTIEDLLDASSGHALVLFTSYDLMEAVSEALDADELDYPIFTLRRNDPHILDKFRSTPGAVLLATGSAWEGMDFPGDQVSLLIIPRLPFVVPDEFRKRQQMDYDSVPDYIRAVVVPDMQIKLRQGFGRAIRTETDTCAVAILDERSIPGARYYNQVSSTNSDSV